MAPEQWEDSRAVDIRADIYSLGCTLYHLLAGKPPFGGDEYPTLMKQMWAHAQAPLPPLREHRPEVPQGVVAVIERMLAKKPEERFAAPAEVAASLEPYAAMIPGHDSSVFRSRPSYSALSQRPARKWSLRRLGVGAGLAVVLLLAAGTLAAFFSRGSGARAGGLPLKIGVLHSRTGTMAISEKPVIDATLFAVEELNAKGGVLGRKVEAVVEDGASDWPTFARQADTGAAPNQQIIPAIKWSCSFLKKKRLFLVGSDYIFPRAAHMIIRDQVADLEADIVGEEFLPLGSTDMGAVVKKIQARKPDLIVNTINGDTNVAFFRALRQAGLTSENLPTISFSVSEEELSSLSAKQVQGDYAAWNYFQSIDLPENQEFVSRFKARFGSERILSDPMEAAYIAVHLWAQAVEAAGSDDVNAIRQAINDQSFDAPEGKVTIDPQTHHISKFIRIGRITENGRFEVVYCSDSAINPIPYPATRSKADWDAVLSDLHLLWGGQWANPEPAKITASSKEK